MTNRTSAITVAGLGLSFALLGVVPACTDTFESPDEIGANDADLRGRHHKCRFCGMDAAATRDAASSGDGAGTASDSATAVDAAPSTNGGYPSVALDATGQSFYVSASAGNDANDGSAAHPWKTIGHAAATVKAGTSGVTVHVAPGTYAEAIAMSVSGSASARVVFVSDTRWGAHVDASGHYWGWQSTGDYVDIVGFEVTGSDYIGIGIGGSHCRTIDNHVHHLAAPTCNTGNGGAGIDDYEYAEGDDDMIGNVVHDIGNPGCSQIQGLYHSNYGGKILNNIVYRISGWGLHTWHNPKNVVIANNLSFQNGSGGLVVGAGDAPYNGVAEGFVVTNNIFYDNLGWGMVEEGQYGTNTFVANLVYKNAGGNTSLANPSTDELRVDPSFVDYRADGSGDYRLKTGSPAIDTGTTQGAPTFAIDGAPRPQGNGMDRGPYEK